LTSKDPSPRKGGEKLKRGQPSKLPRTERPVTRKRATVAWGGPGTKFRRSPWSALWQPRGKKDNLTHAIQAKRGRQVRNGHGLGRSWGVRKEGGKTARKKGSSKRGRNGTEKTPKEETETNGKGDGTPPLVPGNGKDEYHGGKPG